MEKGPSGCGATPRHVLIVGRVLPSAGGAASPFPTRPRRPIVLPTQSAPTARRFSRCTSATQHPPRRRPAREGAWWKELTRYQWFVFVVASLGWLFDTMDQQLFTLARVSAVRSLLGILPGDTSHSGLIDEYAGYTTSIFLIGWAIGGIIFGILGDKIGRVKTMTLTILCYSAFTGLSAYSKGIWDFSLWRFLTGLGVGGQLAVSVSLVAEVDVGSRPADGAGLAPGALGRREHAGGGDQHGAGPVTNSRVTIANAWRAMFLVGMVPALLVIPIFLRLKEPERWKAAAREGELDGDGKPRLGSLAELFGDPRWRRNTIVGMVLAFAGVVGLWGIGFFSFDLVDSVFRKHFQDAGAARTRRSRAELTYWKGITSLVQNAGRVLRHLRLRLREPVPGPQAGVRDLVRPGRGLDRADVLVSSTHSGRSSS